ncbi:MAG: heme o synthase [Burkholderiales bacterium]
MGRFRDYFSLTKPGIVLGNLVSVAGGFLLGSRGQVSGTTFVATLLGMALVIGGGCVLNNCIDRDIDALMQRTCNRPLVKKRVTLSEALILAVLLASNGFLLLVLFTSPLVSLITLAGFLVYVGLYSLGLKRTQHGTWVGSLSGAVPPLAGYCAASQQIDLAGLILFAMYALWQFPHAYAIAVLHLQDYARASIPVLPVVRGVALVRRHMPAYVATFTASGLLLFITHNTGWGYLAVLLGMGFAWMRSAWNSRYGKDDRRWAKTSFIYSVVMIMALSIMMSVNNASLHVPHFHIN